MIRVGKLLEKERQELNITLEEVAKATKIRVSYLLAIEKGDYKKLPSGAYVTGFIKNYINYLGLPQKEYLALFRREFNEKEHLRVLPQSLTPKKELPIRRFRINQTILGVFVLFLFLFAYLFLQYRYAIIAPPLTLSLPKEGEQVSSSLIVSGQTDPDASVTVNDMPVSVDASGVFRKTLNLFPGKATVSVKAQNRIGKATEIERSVEVREK